jgi:hypothetical protein
MRSDLYTKAVLTVIAACLVWLCLGGPSILPGVRAQTEYQRVVIIGWQEGNGRSVSFPPTPNRNDPLPVRETR